METWHYYQALLFVPPFKTSLEEWKHNWQIDVTESANTFKTSLEEWKPCADGEMGWNGRLLKLP